MPRKNVIELDTSVEQALERAISLGVVLPPWQAAAELASPKASS